MILGAGYNKHSQLGVLSNGTNSMNLPIVTIPTQIPIDPNDLACISCGSSHSIFVMKNGKVLASGSDEDFQIGSENRTIYKEPTEINISAEPIKWATCGDFYTCYLTASGAIIICSKKNKGEKINVTLQKPAIMVAGSDKAPAAIDCDGAVYLFDHDPLKPPIRYVLPLPVYDISRCCDFTVAITTDGVAYGNGILNNKSEDFAPIKSLQGLVVRRVFGFSGHCAVLINDGRLMLYGDNASGQLGTIADYSFDFTFATALKDNDVVHVDVGSYHTIAVCYDGSVYGFGDNTYQQLFLNQTGVDCFTPTKAPIEGKATYVECGNFHSFLIVGAPRPEHPGMSHFQLESMEMHNPIDLARINQLEEENKRLKEEIALLQQKLSGK